MPARTVKKTLEAAKQWLTDRAGRKGEVPGPEGQQPMARTTDSPHPPLRPREDAHAAADFPTVDPDSAIIPLGVQCPHVEFPEKALAALQAEDSGAPGPGGGRPPARLGDGREPAPPDREQAATLTAAERAVAPFLWVRHRASRHVSGIIARTGLQTPHVADTAPDRQAVFLCLPSRHLRFCRVSVRIQQPSCE